MYPHNREPQLDYGSSKKQKFKISNKKKEKFMDRTPQSSAQKVGKMKKPQKAVDLSKP